MGDERRDQNNMKKLRKTENDVENYEMAKQMCCFYVDLVIAE